MAKKFSIAEFAAPEAVSKVDTIDVVRIPWDRIRANDANFYSVDDVEELRNSIRMHGLLDPVVVTPDEEEGKYLLISGHRRHKAWGLLREEDPEKYASIPAIVRRFESKSMAELALIMANSSARKLTSPEISRQAERIERLLYDLKEEGYEFDGRMRDQVAKACQVSSTKLARLKVIRENLLIDFKKQWEAGKLNESCAYELAQGSSVFQEKILRVKPDATAYGIAAVRKIMEGGNDYSCAALCGPGCLKCTHQQAFLRHDLEDPWNACEGKKCCLTCDKAKRDWYPCPRMCSKAKEKRSAANAKEKEKEKAEQEKKTNRIRREIRESALRLLKAAEAAGADDKTEIKLATYGSKNVAYLRKAAGDGDIGYFYFNELAPQKLDVPAVARALKCSADYVCGLTDELQPRAVETPAPTREPMPDPMTAPTVTTSQQWWRSCRDDPPKGWMLAVVLTPVDRSRKYFDVDLMQWHDGKWWGVYDASEDEMDADASWWMPAAAVPAEVWE